MNANNLTGVFSLSNSIMVNRNHAEGGTISGGPFNFTIDVTPEFLVELLWMDRQQERIAHGS